MASRVGLIGCLIFIFALLGCATAAHNSNNTIAGRYYVGDNYGWAVPPTNFTDFYANWTNDKKFQMFDTVVFIWKGNHTVTQVPKEYYDNCTKNGSQMSGSPYTFEIRSSLMLEVSFNVNNTLYYICTVDTHCEQGQKVKIVVGNGILNTGSAPSLTVGALSAFFSTIVIFFLNYI